MYYAQIFFMIIFAEPKVES